MRVIAVDAKAAGSLVAVGALAVTRPVVATGDTLTAVIATVLAVGVTPPEGFMLLRTDTAIGLSLLTYSKNIADAAAEPSSYTWTFALAVVCAAVVGCYRGTRGVWSSAAAATGVDTAEQAVTIRNPQLGNVLVTVAAGIRLALTGAGTSWSINSDPQRAQYNNSVVVGTDISIALHDSATEAPLGGVSRTATASLTQTELVVLGLLLSSSDPAVAQPSFLAQPIISSPVIRRSPPVPRMLRR